MRFAIIVFPGTWSDRDCLHVLDQVFHQSADLVWHKEEDLSRYDCAILPGGFSYGDYLRCGAIARFSPVMRAVGRMAAEGKPVLGICNGFQILCEAGLLPGVLMRNAHLEYRCQWVTLRVERPDTPFTRTCREGQVLRIPISHGEGNYFADPATLAELAANSQVVFRYASPVGEVRPEDNPNGSLHNIAGIVNKAGNVLGMMPHPERCCEAVLGGEDGRFVFQSVIQSLLDGVPLSGHRREGTKSAP
ncbi:MAG: phosphoribosylformylglycinamidine synthase subunit PurQ [Chloroflexi bacterium]|nr:phosphoribosylformylglycinamidine synthase subunit PurQ [Chloroflexota bacterium]